MRSPLPYAFLISLSCATSGHAQSFFTLDGVVKERDGYAVMTNVTILAGDTVDKSADRERTSARTNAKGKYRLRLPYDHVYEVEYWAQGHVAKRVILDLTRVKAKDQEGNNTMSLEISLFQKLGGVDYAACKAPVAICRWNRSEKKFLWDDEYGKQREMELAAVEKDHVAVVRGRANKP